MASRGPLSIPAFRSLFIGQTISQFGDAFYYLVFVYMVDKLTGDPRLVGFVAAIQGLPYLLLSPLAGSLADRLDRRKLMVFSDVASTVILVIFGGYLLTTDRPSIVAIFIVAGLLNCVNVLFVPAKGAALPRLVPDEMLLKANSLSAAVQSSMPVVGLALSAAVLGGVERAAPNSLFLVAVFVNAATFLLSASFLRQLPALIPDRQEKPQGAWRETVEGVRFLWSNHLLKMVFLLSLGLNLFIAPFLVVYAAANREWFDGTYLTLATFEVAFAGAMVVASLFVGRLRLERPGLTYSISLASIGLMVAAMAVSQTFWPFLFWNLLCGLALPFATIPLTTYVQLIVPDAFRGRVNSALAMASLGVMPFGAAIGGLMLGQVGLAAMFAIMGFGMGAVAILGLADAKFRAARMPEAAVPS